MRTEVRRTLVSLSVSFALMWATVSMVTGPASAVLVVLTGDLMQVLVAVVPALYLILVRADRPRTYARRAQADRAFR